MEKMKLVLAKERRIKNATELKQQLEAHRKIEKVEMSLQEININKAKLQAYKEAKRQGKL